MQLSLVLLLSLDEDDNTNNIVILTDDYFPYVEKSLHATHAKDNMEI